MRAWPLLLLLGCVHRGHGPLEEEEDPRLEAAKCCMGAKAWEASEAGWKSPRFASWILATGDTAKLKLAQTRGMTYRYEACADEGVVELDLILYDRDGTPLARDEMPGREPVITWTAPSSGVRYLVVYLRQTAGGATGAISQVSFTYADDGAGPAEAP